MTRRIVAIVFIFLCTSFAWAILGATLFARTYDSGSLSASAVESTWGAAQNQAPPTASFMQKIPKQGDVVENSKIITKTWTEDSPVDLPLESSNVNVDLDLDHRQKGLLWYSTYKVRFDGVYHFRNTSNNDETVTFQLHFPTTQAIYDNLTFVVDGNPVALTNEKNTAKTAVKIGAGQTTQLHVGYISQGLNEWR